MGKFINTLSFAKEMDKNDVLGEFKKEFFISDDYIYMDGNSLGLLPKSGEEVLMRVLSDTKKLGIDLWSKTDPNLFSYQDYLAELMTPLVGCSKDEVTLHANTTINIHSMIATLYKPTDKKYKILVDDLNFPTGRYAIESQIRLKNLDESDVIKEIKSKDGNTIDEDDIITGMTEDVALVFIPSVLYRSGQLVDVEKIAKEANKKGIVIGIDCCHGIGAIKHEFSKWNIDFAVWCTYKYLNGGPGATGAFYLNKKHHDKKPGLAGWHGYVKDKQFDLRNDFQNAKNAGGWQTGTPNILSMAPLEGSLKVFDRAGIDRIREKSLKLTDYLMYLIEENLTEYGFSIGNPREHDRRGGHVALVHEEAIRINSAMKDNGVLPDFRFPNVIRLAPIALYTSFEDVYSTVNIIKNIMNEKIYEKYDNKRGTVA